jgi:N-acetylmuramoyl-L-alanine amidase
MRGRFLLAAILGIWLMGAAGEGMAAPRLLGVRKSSGPESTRVVLDLEAPPAYEVQSAASSPILTIYLQKMTLPQGALEILVEDRVVRKVRVDPAEKDGAKVVFFLYQPTRWKVFALTPEGDKPDRLVIDIFRPAGEMGERGEKPESKPPVVEKEKVEKPASKPPGPEPRKEKELPAKVGSVAGKPPRPEIPEPKIPPPKVEEPPRAVAPEEPREKGGSPAKGIARLLEIRHWSAPDHTRVVADLEGAPEYEILPQTDPLVFTLQLRGVLLPKGSQEVLVEDPVIRRMKVEPESRNEAKLSLFLIKPGRLNVFLLKPFEDKTDRLVIDVSRPDLEEKEKEQRQFTRELKAKKKRIVVIDPGHGGDDPGAVGPRKTLEKDIVLALAQNLQKTLDATGEIRAFLTRRGDYFIPLNDRVKMAQEYGADLFISLHANGSRSRQTKGSSIYCLSIKGASDKATQVLAQKENASDMVGGTSLAPVQKDLDTILLDLEQTHAINESLQLGGLALNELGRINHIQFSQPRQAGFAVLKSPEFPSILVETAYITHPTEEILLRKKNFQDRLCQAITAAVKRYIPILSAKEAKPTGDSLERPAKKRGG